MNAPLQPEAQAPQEAPVPSQPQAAPPLATTPAQPPAAPRFALPVQTTAQMLFPWTHWFLYGETGSGKTVAASTFPRPLFLVPKNENSMVSLRGQNHHFIEIDYNSGLHTIRMIQGEIARHGNDWPYDTLVFESLSHYQEDVINYLTDGREKDMSMPLWGKFANHFQVLHDNLRALEMHVVFTALAKSDLDASKVAVGGPMLSGNAGFKLPSACDVIGYCVVEQTKMGPRHRIHFKKYGPYAARSRFPRMPYVVDNFRFQDIAQYLA